MLLPEGRLENIKRSFDVWIESVLGTTFTLANGSLIKYDGSSDEVDLTSIKEWIEPFVVGPARPQSGLGRALFTSGYWAQNVLYILQVNIFNRPSRQTVGHRLHALRDVVMDVLHERVTIPVLDYHGASAPLGSLVCRAPNLDTRVPVSEAVDEEQWSYSVEAQWMELTTT